MNVEERKKMVKHKLIDKGLSFRSWCTETGVSRSLAKDLVSGRLDASRSEAARNVKRILQEEFGENLFD